MGLESLFLFTLLGGMAAGAYAFETGLARKREGSRPWLVPLVVVVLFAIGVIAAATHVRSIPNAMQSVFGGTVNLGSGMAREVLVAGVFLVLAIVDMAVTFARKPSPYALRVITAVVGVVFMIMMATAYTDVYGTPVWCHAPATILSFVTGSLATGLALFVALTADSFQKGALRSSWSLFNGLLIVGMALEAMAFMAENQSPAAQLIALVVGPIAALLLGVASPKVKNGRALVIAACALVIVGVAISRYSFYAACMVA